MYTFVVPSGSPTNSTAKMGKTTNKIARVKAKSINVDIDQTPSRALVLGTTSCEPAVVPTATHKVCKPNGVISAAEGT